MSSIKKTRKRINGVVLNLHPNDVLSGQGHGPNQHSGNQRFRDIISENRAEYKSIRNRQAKHKIAKRIYDQILASGGRFLVLKGNRWCVESNEVLCLEKVKQALRQKKEYHKHPEGSVFGPQPRSVDVPRKPKAPVRASNVVSLPVIAVRSIPVRRLKSASSKRTAKRARSLPMSRPRSSSSASSNEDKLKALVQAATVVSPPAIGDGSASRSLSTKPTAKDTRALSAPQRALILKAPTALPNAPPLPKAPVQAATAVPPPAIGDRSASAHQSRLLSTKPTATGACPVAAPPLPSPSLAPVLPKAPVQAGIVVSPPAMDALSASSCQSRLVVTALTARGAPRSLSAPRPGSSAPVLPNAPILPKAPVQAAIAVSPPAIGARAALVHQPRLASTKPAVKGARSLQISALQPGSLVASSKLKPLVLQAAVPSPPTTGASSASVPGPSATLIPPVRVAAKRRRPRKIVASLNENDVLMGRRGNHYCGNRRFLDMVDAKREEYAAQEKRQGKRAIAKRIYDNVIGVGGRFLSLTPETESVRDPFKNGIWYVEESEHLWMEKCMQALRQKVRRRSDRSVSGPQLSSVSVKLNDLGQAAAAVSSPAMDTSAEGALDQVGTAASIPNDDSPAESEVSEYLSSVLALSGRPTFSEEQDAAKKHDLDPDDVAFLVKRMRAEIEKIPEAEKEALVEAQKKCRQEEFSDSRLEEFLRCEGMSARLAALRFCNYWHARRGVFGKEKYLQRMALNEALRDDTAALEGCVLSLLPQQDLSGHHVLYLDPSRRTIDGYTSESLLRAIWYVIEVAAQENTFLSSHAVQVVRYQNMSAFVNDTDIYNRIHYLETSCWPIRNCFFHLCCPPSDTMRALKPVLLAAMDETSRAKMVFHTVAEDELLTVLEEFGIQKEMLPTDLGGTLALDQKEWVAKRRAAELQQSEGSD